MAWVRDPHRGGIKIPSALQEQIKRRLLAHAEKNYPGQYERLEVWFRGSFCYIDAYTKPPAARRAPPGETLAEYRRRLSETPTHLCRLRFCSPSDGARAWSVAFFTYSHEKYEPAMFQSGDFYGTPEEGLDVGAVYLQG